MKTPSYATRAHSPAHQQSAEEADLVLLALISAGDRSAIEKLYALYFVRLANFLRHLTMRGDLVDELIDDTMLELWRESGSLAADSSVSVAIARLAYCSAKKRIVEASEIPPRLQHDVEDTDHDPSLMVFNNAAKKQDCFLDLPFEERALLHLVYACGYSRPDIAKIMDISCECVDALLGDARLRCR
jgi:DNA-directed RNA polymerase specialized sigma24 family protein